MGSTGKLTGYSGGNGIPTKKKLLALEGISFK
jgi:O6-methylguanine-DNA--protein-cysteine methyltransferase